MNRRATATVTTSAVVSANSTVNDALGDSLIGDLPAMVHSINAEGVIVDVSRKWLEVLGYSRSDAIGRKSTDFLTEESRAYASENVLPEFFRTGRCVDVPYQIVAGDGRILDVLLSATCIRGDDGQVVRSIAIMHDVTARKKAERKLDAARNYAENLLHTANVMVVELDKEGRVTRLNRATEEMVGYAAADLRGRGWFETVTPAAQLREIQRRIENLSPKESGDRFETVVRTREGAERRVVWRNSPIIENDLLVGILCVGVDVTEQRVTQARLQDSEKALREAQGVANLGSWMLDYDRRQLVWSDVMFRVFGLDPKRDTACESALLDAIHPDDRAEVARAYMQALAYHRPYDLRHRLLLADGTLKYVQHRTEISLSDSGRPARVVGVVQDVTMSVLQEMALQESELRFRTIADYTYDWEYWQGAGKEILYVSPSCSRVTGYSQSDFVQDPGLLVSIVHPDDRRRFVEHLCEAECHDDLELEFRILTKDGQERWISHGCRPVYSADGKRNGRRVSNRDVTELKVAEHLAYRLAYYDPLTDLPNRRLLTDRLGKAIQLASRQHNAMALMFIDLDRFKTINDTFGHDAGDALLIEVGHRFVTCLRESDTVARTGGDEFIVLLPDIASPENVSAVATKLLEVLHEPIVCGLELFEVSASIGIVVRVADGVDDSATLMKKADIAMYAAKQAGRNCYEVFSE